MNIFVNKIANNLKNMNIFSNKFKFTNLFFLCGVIIAGLVFLAYQYNANYFYYNGIYEQSLFPIDKFNKIKDICSQINDNAMVEDPKAHGRLMYTFMPNDPIVALINSNDFIEKVQKLTGNYNLIPSTTIPIEYRKYKIGAYMDWHRDTIMLNSQLQYECVITVTNDSDSETLFDKVLYTSHIKSEPNSLVIVRAAGVNHMVTKLSKGERTIIKLVFCEKGMKEEPIFTEKY